MRVLTRAYLNTISTLLLLLTVEAAFVLIARSFELGWVMLVLGPLAFLVAIIVWLNKVSGIRCRKCKNVYGVSIGLGGWPSVPSKCLHCGANDNDL